MEPKIIFEDDDLLVLDKPAGITVNKSDTTVGEETVQDWVMAYGKWLMAENRVANPDYQTFYDRAGIVHRLDKETSGILLVAKSPESFANLQRQFKERKVKKTYLALAHGKLPEDLGEIKVPVGRLPWNRKRFGVMAGGRDAVTRYKVVSKYVNPNKETLSLLELYPETGRTHQIRVHLKYIGHPIFSDPLYAGRKTSRNDRKLLPRVFLHANKISFYHPRTKDVINFESKLPADLEKFLGELS